MHLNKLKAFTVVFVLVLAGSTLVFSQKNDGPVDFSMRSVDGQTISAESLRGEVVVLAFGASWLPLSRAQLQGIRKLADEYSNRSVVVYFVSTESEDEKSKNFASDAHLRAFATKYGLKVTVLRDPDGDDLERDGRGSTTVHYHSRQTGQREWRADSRTRSERKSRRSIGVAPGQDSVKHSR